MPRGQPRGCRETSPQAPPAGEPALPPVSADSGRPWAQQNSAADGAEVRGQLGGTCASGARAAGRLQGLHLFPSLARVMTRLLDHPEAMVLPWHEVLEPCLNCLSGPSSDFEVPEPWQGWGRERQLLDTSYLMRFWRAQHSLPG